MKTHTDTNQTNQSPAAADRSRYSQQNNESNLTAQLEFVDDRPEAIEIRTLQELANNSPQILQMQALQEMADNRPAQESFTTLQRIANKYAAKKELPGRNKTSQDHVQIANENGLRETLNFRAEHPSRFSTSDLTGHHNSVMPGTLQMNAYVQRTADPTMRRSEERLPQEAWHRSRQKQGVIQHALQMKETGGDIRDDAGLKKAEVPGNFHDPALTALPYSRVVTRTKLLATSVTQRALLDPNKNHIPDKITLWNKLIASNLIKGDFAEHEAIIDYIWQKGEQEDFSWEQIEEAVGNISKDKGIVMPPESIAPDQQSGNYQITKDLEHAGTGTEALNVGSHAGSTAAHAVHATRAANAAGHILHAVGNATHIGGMIIGGTELVAKGYQKYQENDEQIDSSFAKEMAPEAMKFGGRLGGAALGAKGGAVIGLVIGSAFPGLGHLIGGSAGAITGSIVGGIVGEEAMKELSKRLLDKFGGDEKAVEEAINSGALSQEYLEELMEEIGISQELLEQILAIPDDEDDEDEEDEEDEEDFSFVDAALNEREKFNLE